MKKSIILLITTLFLVNAQSDFWKNFEKSFQDFGENLSSQLEAQGRLIEENARRYAAQVEQEQKIYAQKINEQKNEIFEIVRQIESGNPPSETNSNTTSFTTKVNGKDVTIKNTVYSTGNDTKGAIHNVQTIYKESMQYDWSINSLWWQGNQTSKNYWNKENVVSTYSQYVINSNVNDQQFAILQTAEQIESGNPPSGIKSSTISLPTNVNGKVVTVKNTIYSTGNSQSGRIDSIQSTYQEATRRSYSILSFIWDNNQVIRKHFSNNGILRNIVINSNNNIITF